MLLLLDSHIHVGQYFDQYYSPTYVSKLMADVGVAHYVVSSTTMCEENYEKVLEELHELIRLDGERVLPIMWITPEGLKGNIAWFLESDIQWRCVKVHPELHPDDWDPDGEQFAEVLDIVRELDLPLLIHTGNKDCCLCSKYETLIASNPDVTFILAHGRPLNDAIRIASTYTNAYVDTAFMPVDEIRELVNHGLCLKILWGTDMCIPHHFFPNEDLKSYYQKKLANMKLILTPEHYEMITYTNARRVFKII